jgi:XTP/dITP diphosphohydrolase
MNSEKGRSSCSFSIPSGLPSSSRRRVVLASFNAGKLREMRALLAHVAVDLVPLSDWPGAALPAEGRQSYADNATRKAMAAARLTGCVAIADDSGLEVDALGGAPGVESARFGGALTDAERCALLLARLQGVPVDRRGARFRCVIAVAHPDGRVETDEGSVEGLIATAPRGSAGFGYDPVFYYPPLARTFAELDPEDKARVSHRAVALRKAARRLG